MCKATFFKSFINRLSFYFDMAQDKVQLPSGMGGLVRYYDEYKSKLEFKPGTIILFIVLTILIEILLHIYGRNWFG